MSKNDGGSIFPEPPTCYASHPGAPIIIEGGNIGLTVRQFYKAVALQGLLATAGHLIEGHEPYLLWLINTDRDAQVRMRYLPDLAAQMADAMLQEDAEFAAKGDHE